MWNCGSSKYDLSATLRPHTGFVDSDLVNKSLCLTLDDLCVLTWDVIDSRFIADNALVSSIVHLYQVDRKSHDELAAKWTHRFAK